MRRPGSSSGQDEDVVADKSKVMTPDVGVQPRKSLERRRNKDASGARSETSPRSSYALEQPSPQVGEPTQETRPSYRIRARGPWSCSLPTVATSVCSILLLLTIIRSFITLQLDPKGCAMSYMMPSFVHFPDFDTEHTRFASKYSLYLYREGRMDEDTRVKGIPVLFIPGNAGSYKQVRPIAAEAAHYFHDVLRGNSVALGDGKRPLDFFTVDFNEELTAFHGQTLLDQAEYLNEVVAYILALYLNPHRSLREPGLPDPKSVMILGHSMGGVVARTMLHMPNYQQDTINTIFTLSAPHARPPISFDAQMVSTYNEVNSYWRQSLSGVVEKENPLADITLVSVAGGGLDTMIPSEYSSLTSLVPDTHGFTVFTSAIPTVWTGMDHLAIMWCDQFRKALVKAMFDVVDIKRPTQTLKQPERIKALRKRLLTGMESVVEKAALENEPTVLLSMERHLASIVPLGQRLDLRSMGGSSSATTFFMPIPASPALEGSRFTLLTDQNLVSGDDNATLSVFLCNLATKSLAASSVLAASTVAQANIPAGSTKLECKNAASDVSLLPASTKESSHAFDKSRPFSYLQYELDDISNYQFVAVVDQAAEHTPGWVMAEFSSATESSIKVSRGHHQLLYHGLRLQLPESRPMMTELKIPEVHSTLFAYRLTIERQKMDDAKEAFAPLLRQYIQEPYESKYFVNTEGGNINVHGISPYMPPPLSGGGASEGLSLQLWTDRNANSTVVISLKVDVLGSAGKLVMRYRNAFAAFPLLVVAIIIRKQFKVYDSTGIFISFSQSMDLCLSTSLPAIIAALTFLAVALSKASQGPLTRSLFSIATGATSNTVDFTVNDLMLGTSDPFFWFLVPLFGVMGVGICITTNYLVLAVTHILAWIVFLVRSWTSTATDLRVSTTAQQRILTTGVLLLLLVTIIPYHFAYVVLCIVQLSTSIRALRAARDTQTDQAHNLSNYAHSILVLMLWILPISLPVLVVWIHNLAVHWLTPFETHRNLLSVLPYILLVECMSTGTMIPRVTSRYVLRTPPMHHTFSADTDHKYQGTSYHQHPHVRLRPLCCRLRRDLRLPSSSHGQRAVRLAVPHPLLRGPPHHAGAMGPRLRDAPSRILDQVIRRCQRRTAQRNALPHQEDAIAHAIVRSQCTRRCAEKSFSPQNEAHET
nr:gpi inositol-deacylase [Quercus suber]